MRNGQPQGNEKKEGKQQREHAAHMSDAAALQ